MTSKTLGILTRSKVISLVLSLFSIFLWVLGLPPQSFSSQIFSKKHLHKMIKIGVVAVDVNIYSMALR